MTIQEFLESRIEEDAHLARKGMSKTALEDSRLVLADDGRVSATGWRMLNEVALKREMLFSHDDGPSEDSGKLAIVCVVCQEPYPCQSLRIAAAVYSDHPLYRPEWRPDDPDLRELTEPQGVAASHAPWAGRDRRRQTDSWRTGAPVASL